MPFKHATAGRHLIPKARYRVRNPPAYEAGRKQRDDLTLWLDEGAVTRWQAAPRTRPGGQAWYSNAAIELVLMLRLVFHLALRQTEGFTASVLRLLGHELRIPDHTRLSRRGRSFAERCPEVVASGPLHLLIDSTGIKVEGEGEWNARKHGGSKRRIWRKIHIGIDEQTLEIRAAEFTTSFVGDPPMLPELLDQIPPDQEIASVTADGAFDTRKCHDAISARDAAAAIPPRKNAKPWKADGAGAIARNEALRASRRFGRTIWQRWSGYYRRSRAETKMHCVKLLGQRLAARGFDRQVAEFQVRVAVLNGFTALGIPVTEAVE